MIDRSSGFRLNNNKLIINLLSSAKDAKKLVIDLPEYCSIINNDNIKTVTFKKENENDYFIIFVYSEKQSNNKLNKSNFLSIDLGYSNIVTGYSNVINNIQIKNLKFKKLQRRIEYLQSYRDHKKKESNK
jgi:transposase